MHLPPQRLPRSRRWLFAVSGTLVLVLLDLLCPHSLPAQSEPVGKRPGSHPEFKAGVIAFDKEQWEEVATRMRAALEHWPEDGEMARIYGRRFEAYLPHYYLGVALYQSGCYKAALEEFRKSLLSQHEIPGAKEQRDQFVRLKQECENYVRQGIDQAEAASCLPWSESGESEEDEPES